MATFFCDCSTVASTSSDMMKLTPVCRFVTRLFSIWPSKKFEVPTKSATNLVLGFGPWGQKTRKQPTDGIFPRLAEWKPGTKFSLLGICCCVLGPGSDKGFSSDVEESDVAGHSR